MSGEPSSSSGDPSQGPRSLSLDERIFIAIRSQNHEEAARLNAEGIALHPLDPKYRISRAAANVFLHNYQEAITDAENALILNHEHGIRSSLPYLHLSRAHMALGDYDLAFTFAEEGLKINPGDWRIKQSLELVRVSGISKRHVAEKITIPELDSIGDTFDGAEMWLKLERDEEARGYRHDPEFREKVSEARKDNLKLGKHLREDRRFLNAFGILLNVRFGESMGRLEPDVDFDRYAMEDNELSFRENVRRNMISAIVNNGPPRLTEQNREPEKTLDEAEEEELTKEYLKLVLEGASKAEEEAQES